jgi:hypothetical protein
MINLSEHLVGFIDNPLSGLRQEYDSLRSLKELDSEFIFQLSNLLAQRRLTDVQTQCGTAEVQFFSHGYQIAQVA